MSGKNRIIIADLIDGHSKSITADTEIQLPHSHGLPNIFAEAHTSRTSYFKSYSTPYIGYIGSPN
jgi:hypothetical protein